MSGLRGRAGGETRVPRRPSAVAACSSKAQRAQGDHPRFLSFPRGRDGLSAVLATGHDPLVTQIPRVP
eukprot:3291541-Pyramimonas_sp.AAC.1